MIIICGWERYLLWHCNRRAVALLRLNPNEATVVGFFWINVVGEYGASVWGSVGVGVVGVKSRSSATALQDAPPIDT